MKESAHAETLVNRSRTNVCKDKFASRFLHDFLIPVVMS